MAAADPRATCIIGVARHTWHPDDAEVRADDGLAPEPLDMWERMARAAAADATASGGGDAVLGALESIDVVYSQSWQYDDAPARLAERLGASPARRRYSGIGGSVPLVLSTEVAKEIRGGHLDLALLTGAEALATVRRLKKAGEKPQWSYRPAERRPFPMDMEFDPSEISHSVFEAYLTFALFDNARRAHLGRALPEHRAALGRIMAAMTSVAAAAPEHAWFPVARSAEEIAGPTADNRMVAYPYTQAHDVDHGRRHGSGRGAGQCREGGRARRARGQAGVPAGLRLRRRPRARGRPPRAVALPRHGRGRGCRARRCRASVPTTSRTSTSIRASRRRYASRSMLWASPRTIRGRPRSPRRAACRITAAPARTT